MPYLYSDFNHFLPLAEREAITAESPLWDLQRNCLWWIDIQAQKLLRTDITGQSQSIYLPWQPGFVAMAQSGKLVLGLEIGLFLYHPETAALEQLTDTESDRPTVRLNDGKPDRQGRLWFGSMDMNHSGRALGRLYRRDLDGSIHIVREDITIPNAIVPDLDEDWLWFCDSPMQKLQKLRIDSQSGAIVAAQTMHQFSGSDHPDGACLDTQGNLWLAIVGSGDVLRISPQGQLLERHASPVTRATMPMLGGPEGNQLFLTSQRRFLSATQLIQQPLAGALLTKKVEAFAAPNHRVHGL